MRNLLFIAIAFCMLCACSSPEPTDVVAKVAKQYYEQLLDGKYDKFVDSYYQPDSIPASYREQLITNAKMFWGQQKEEHKGIKDVRVVKSMVDTVRHEANVFVVFSYGDNTNEETVVPMVEHKGIWYLR